MSPRPVIPQADRVFLIHSGPEILPAPETLVAELHASEFDISNGDGNVQAWLDKQISENNTPALIIIAAPVITAVRVGRVARRMGASAELLFIVCRTELALFRQKAMHTPLGKFRMIPASDVPVVLATARERLRAARQRRNFRTTIDRINLEISAQSAVEPRELRRLIVSDRYGASIFATAADAIFFVDSHGCINAWNQSAANLFHLESPEGRRLEELPLGECGQQLHGLIKCTLAGQKLPAQQLGCDLGGKRIEIEAAFAPVLDDEAAVIGVSVIARDMRATIRAKRLLHAEHQIARLLVSGGTRAVTSVLQILSELVGAKAGEFWRVDASTKLLDCGEVWLDSAFEEGKRFSDSSKEFRFRIGEGLPGRVWKSLSPTAIRDVASDTDLPRADLAREVGLRSALAFPIATVDEFIGVMNFFGESALEVDEPLVQMMRAIGNDIAQYVRRVRAEQALQESVERFRFMAESMPQKIFTANAEGEAEYFNRRWQEFTGLTLDQLRGTGWIVAVHPDDLKESVRRWKQSIGMSDGYEMEHRFRSTSGEYRWHLTRARALRDKTGRITLWIGSSTDIQEQKEAAEKLERVVAERTQQLRETVEELEAFSYSISHDLRSPLRAMQGYSEALLEEFKDKLGETGEEYLNRIRRSALRMDSLVQDVLAYSRVAKGDIRLGKVDVSRVIQDVIHNYPSLQPERADISVKSPIPLVLGHEAYLMQIVSNLLTNAVKFVAPSRRPSIQIEGSTEGEMVRISFADNGIGIAAEHQHRIFQIFGRVYSDKQYEGTGIGLAIVKKAAERMGGSVALESIPGQGSKFILFLKRAE